MGAIVRNVVNDQLLRLSYKDPKNIKRFLRNWGGLEGLSEKGDTVATCILTDLKTVTAIDLDKYHKSDRAEFNKAYRKGKLSHYQYMSIAYVLVLGYTQDTLWFNAMPESNRYKNVQAFNVVTLWIVAIVLIIKLVTM